MALPLFIVLEGIDGSGTTTQAARLAEHLRAHGRSAHVTREPSTGPIGSLVREILLGQHSREDGVAVAGDTMALLFAADRKDHLFREIEPALQRGDDVVCDRYQWSSLAYQAEETDHAWVAALARNLRKPDLTFLIDLPVQIAAQRRTQAGRAIERYDADPVQMRVAANYRTLAEQDPSSIVIDGTPDVDSVTHAIATRVDRVLAGAS